MQKHRVKVLLIGNDEGPKNWFAQHLTNKRAQAPVSGISLDRRTIRTATTEYDIWCVDSHELYNIRVPVHYYRGCQQVLIVPKDDADLKHILECLQPHISSECYTICIPTADFMKHSNSSYRFLVTEFAKKEFQSSSQQQIQFIESTFHPKVIAECERTTISF